MAQHLIAGKDELENDRVPQPKLLPAGAEELIIIVAMWGGFGLFWWFNPFSMPK